MDLFSSVSGGASPNGFVFVLVDLRSTALVATGMPNSICFFLPTASSVGWCDTLPQTLTAANRINIGTRRCKSSAIRQRRQAASPRDPTDTMLSQHVWHSSLWGKRLPSPTELQRVRRLARRAASRQPSRGCRTREPGRLPPRNPPADELQRLRRVYFRVRRRPGQYAPCGRRLSACAVPACQVRVFRHRRKRCLHLVVVVVHYGVPFDQSFR